MSLVYLVLAHAAALLLIGGYALYLAWALRSIRSPSAPVTPQREVR